jgi:large repetitive protein
MMNINLKCIAKKSFSPKNELFYSLFALVFSALLFSPRFAGATVFNVSTLVDGGPGSLRAAILAANNDVSATAVAPHIIDMSGLSGTINLDSAMRNVENHISFNGPANNVLTLRRNPAASTFSVLLIKPFSVPNIVVRLNNLVITEGNSLTGGGIYVEASTLIINQCRIFRNFSSNGLGGGICINDAQVEINNSTIDNNRNLAGLGGGIYMNLGSLFLHNCTVFGNRASIGGGIDKADVGSMIINNCTFNKDTADDIGGGIYNDQGVFELNNSIVTGNIGVNGGNDVVQGVFSTHGHNIIGDINGVVFFGNQTGNTGAGVNASFVLSQILANNSGPTPTVVLVPCSPAIDNGTSAAYTPPVASATDQRGIIRNNFGIAFDIGALEYSGPITSDVSRCGPGLVTLNAFGGTAYLWYDAPVGGILLGFGASFTTSINANNTIYLADFFNGCESTPRIPVNITIFPLASQPSITAQGPVTFCDGGSVVLSSSSDPTYVSFDWDPGTGTNQTLNVSAAGSYTVTATDVNGCSATSTPVLVTVNPIPVPVITASGSLNLCAGSTFILSSSFTTGNVWSTGETNDSIVVNTSGSYFTVVTDLNGCSGQSNTIVVNSVPLPQTPIITANGPTTFCLGGSVTLSSNSVLGNVWGPNGETSQSITVSSPGTYYVTVTDLNNCVSDTAFITVVVDSLPVVTISPAGPINICQGATQVLTSSLTGGNVWSDNSTGNTLTVSNAGTYFVTFTDGNGCSSVSNSVVVNTVTPPQAPTISANGPLTFCDGNSVSLTSSIANDILWSTGETTQTIVVTASGSYTVSVTLNGCSTSSQPTTVTVTPGPQAAIITPSGPTTFCDGSSVTLTSDITSGIVWSTGAITPSIVVSTSGSYTVSVADGAGCTTESAPVVVTVNPLPSTPTITPSGPTTFCQGQSVTLTSSAISGNVWSTGETTQSIVVSTTQNVTVTVTDGNLCSATSATVSITVNPLPSQPTITSSGNATICAGESIDLTSSSAQDYSWNPGPGNTQTISVTQAGSYTVTITDLNGCTSTSLPFNVNVNQPLQATITGDNAYCQGSSANLAASAGVSWFWSNGQSSQNISVSQSGSYTVIITDANNCTSLSAPFIVSELPTPNPVVTPAGPIQACSNQQVLLTSSIGNGNVWSNGESTQTINVTSSGQYFTVITGANGCVGTSNTVDVTILPAPVAPIVTSSGSTTICSGASVTLTSDVASNIVWNTGETTASITVSLSGSYFVTLTAANGCTASSLPIAVLVDVAPSTPLLPSPIIQCGGVVTLDAGPVNPGTSYLWSTGAITQTITISQTGNYSVTLTNNCGTATSNTSIVTILPIPVAPVVTANGPTTFCFGGSVDLTSDVSTSVLWNTAATTQTISVNQSGNYFVVFTDANGCTAASNTINVVVDIPLVAPVLPTNISQCGGGFVLDAGFYGGSTTYLWSTGETTQTIVVNSSGAYSVDVSNSCGTVNSNTANITIIPLPPVPVVTANGPTTFCQGGSITLTSSALSGNLWNTGETTQSILVNQTGTYFVIISGANGCSNSSNSVLVIVDIPPTATNLGGPFVQCGGSVELNAGNQGGSTTYLWSNGETTPIINATLSGNYDVVITNACGSVSSSLASVTINSVPAVPVILTNGPTTFCQGSQVLLTASTDPSVVSVLWSDGETSNSIFVSTTGSYTVTAFSANNCSSTSLPTVVTVDFPPVAPNLGGPFTQCGGTVLLDADFFGGSTSYLWSNGATTQTILASISGNYSVTISNSCGSVTSALATVIINTVPTTPLISASGPINFCQGGSVSLSVIADPSVVSVLWSTGETTNSISVSTSGIFTVTVFGANGCSSTSAPININVNSFPVAPVLPASISQCGGSVTLDAGIVPFGTTYAWSNGESSQTITVTASGNYFVTLVNSCGSAISNVSQIEILQTPPAPVVISSGPTTFCLGGSIDLTSSLATNLVWSTGETTQTITVNQSGTYFVTFTSVNGCTSTSIPVNVIVDLPPVAPVLPANITQCGGTVTLDAGFLGGSTNYLWSTGATTQAITVSVSGIYSVLVSNSCGIVLSNSSNVTIDPLPPAPSISANSPTTFCQGGSVTLTSSVTSGIVWSNGETNSSIVVSQSGVYTVNVITANGCSSTSNSITVTVDVPPTSANLGGPFVQCAGSLTLSAGNFGGSTTYLWSNGETTPSIVVTQSGNYNVIVSNSCGSVTSTSAAVTINPAPTTPTIQSAGPITFCQGGSVVLSAITDPSVVGLIWSTGETTNSITVDTQGTYSVTVFSANNCSASSLPLNISVDSLPVAPNLGGPFTQCGGVVTLDAGAFGGSTTYLWSNGETTQTINVSVSGNYSVAITNSCGSVISNQAIITIETPPAVPTITANGPVNVCQGSSVDLTVNTNAPVVSVLWSTGETTNTITVNSSQTITVTVTDANGCSSVSLPTIVNISAAPIAVILPDTTNQCGGTVTLDAGILPSGSSYLWSTGATTQTIVVSVSGTYNVAVVNACGSALSNDAVVNLLSDPPIPTITASGPTTFCAGDSVTLTVSNDPLATSILWSTGETTPSIVVSSPNALTVTVSYANGCSSSSLPIGIVVQSLPTAPLIGGPFTQCGGSLTLDAGIVPNGSTYSWSNSETTQSISISQSGDYFVTISNSCGSVTSDTAVVIINPLPNTPLITANGPITFCIGDSVILSSSNPNNNIWSSGETTQSITVSTAGTFSVTVQSAPGCSATSTSISTVVQNPIPSVNLGGDINQCGVNVTLNAGNAGSTYSWTDLTGNNVLTSTQSVTVVNSGFIFVVVSNACNTVTSDTITVTINAAPATPIINVTGSLTFCEGDSVLLVASGGTSVDLITNGDFSAGATGFTSDYILSGNLIPEATYNVGPTASVFHPSFNGSGNNGGNFLVVNGSSVPGQSVWSQTVSVQPNASYDIGLFLSSMVAGNPGQIQMRVDGVDLGGIMNCPGTINTWVPFTQTWTAGLSPFATLSLHSMSSSSGGNDFGVDDITMNCNNCSSVANYVWNTGATGDSLVVDTAGTYTVSIVNGTNCSATSLPVTVNVNLLPQIPLFADTTQCGGAITFDAVNPGASYLWSSGETSQTISVSVSTPNIFVGITNTCGTVFSDTVNATINTIPVFDLGGPYNICNGALVSLDPGLTGLSYDWSTGETTQIIAVGTAGNIILTVTDPLTACSFTDTAIISVNFPPVVNLGPNIIQCGGSVILDAQNLGSTYAWSNGATTQTITLTGTQITTVSVTVTNSCGTTVSAPITIDIRPAPSPAFIVAGGPTTICEGDSVVLFASPGTSYLWSPGGETTNSITVGISGTYGVSVIDGNGCASNAPAVIVDVLPLPVLPAIITANGPTTFCLGGSVTLTSSSLTGNTWLPNGNTNSSITVFNGGPVILTVTSPNGCASVSDTVNIVVNFPPPAFVLTGGNPNLCLGDTLVLTANNGQGFSYLWSPGGQTTQSIVIDTAGDYSVTVTDTNNCSSASINTNVVSISPPPVPVISSSGALACFSGSVTLSASGQGDFVWSNGLGGSVVEVNQPGDYFVTVTNSFFCSSVSDTITLVPSKDMSVVLSSPLYENNQKNIRCFDGSDGVIEAKVEGGYEPYSYAWSNGATTARIEGIKGGNINYVITVTDAYGCTATQTIQLSTPENPLEQTPQGFSPDGNGVNDKFIIPGIESYSNVKIWIYNRWGSELYQVNGVYNTQNAWDGTGPNGSQLPEGTYFMVLEAESPECGTISTQRYIELRRK